MTHPERETVVIGPRGETPVGTVQAVIDGGDMDCGSGLLLLITRAMRKLASGELLAVRSAEPSVAVDLPVWADLTGHGLHADHVEGPNGPWWFAVRKAGAASAEAGSPVTESVFTTGGGTPVGQRLWIYTNFDCNLACGYCCAESSPRAARRRFPLELARRVFDEFGAMGGKEVLFTGGEPFLHPELGGLVGAAGAFERTILTNATVMERGPRLETLTSLERDVVLQVSLDSATPTLHDQQRGAGTWDRAIAGISLARGLGFRVRVAATLYDEDPVGVAALHERLDAEGIEREDRLIRPVAREGFADTGLHISLDALEPEPTLTVDGAWWHPVAVTNPHLRIAESPVPLGEVFGVVRDTVAVQDAAAASGRAVFRCT
jgi:organic radical activating enzyme/TusA-related sulfurtransferase